MNADEGAPPEDRAVPDVEDALPDDEGLLADCRVETFRAGGPGGQHQNTTDSGVRLTHLPTGVSVTARESRSQHRNRKVALARLRAALEERTRPETPRVPTKVPRREKRKRLEGKRRRSEVKRARRKPDPDE
jgi:protein subunit release factor A